MAYAVYDLVFEVDTTPGAAPTLVTVGGIESAGDISIDNQKVDITDTDSDGWIEELITAKQISIEFEGHTEDTDAGQDYIRTLATALGSSAQTTFKITFPNTDTLEIPCNMEVTSLGGGGANDQSAFGFTVSSNGQPTYTIA